MRISLRFWSFRLGTNGQARRPETTPPQPGEGARDRGSRRARPDDNVWIDLRETSTWTAPAIDPERRVELAAQLRARAERAAARQDLRRLRDRHWSGERLLEEGRSDREWWEHPEADPYAVLGLLPGAGIDEAAIARREFAQRYHPDRLGPDADADLAARRMVAANAAYDRLRRALHPV